MRDAARLKDMLGKPPSSGSAAQIFSGTNQHAQRTLTVRLDSRGELVREASLSSHLRRRGELRQTVVSARGTILVDRVIHPDLPRLRLERTLPARGAPHAELTVRIASDELTRITTDRDRPAARRKYASAAPPREWAAEAVRKAGAAGRMISVRSARGSIAVAPTDDVAVVLKKSGADR